MDQTVIALLCGLILSLFFLVMWINRELEIQIQHLAMAIGSIMETIEDIDKRIDALEEKEKSNGKV